MRAGVAGPRRNGWRGRLNQQAKQRGVSWRPCPLDGHLRQCKVSRPARRRLPWPPQLTNRAHAAAGAWAVHAAVLHQRPLPSWHPQERPPTRLSTLRTALRPSRSWAPWASCRPSSPAQPASPSQQALRCGAHHTSTAQHDLPSSSTVVLCAAGRCPAARARRWRVALLAPDTSG